jgi:hypothetical protein
MTANFSKALLGRDKPRLSWVLFFICQALFTFLDYFCYIYLHKTTKQRRERAMYATINENGTLNNYATEPEMYYAEYPSPEQQNRYALQGAIATLFVTGLVLFALAVS